MTDAEKQRIVSITRFQPRILADPKNLYTSSWELAVFEPDVDDQSFELAEDALEAGLHYIARSCDQYEHITATEEKKMLSNLRIVCITTVCMPIPISTSNDFSRRCEMGKVKKTVKCVKYAPFEFDDAIDRISLILGTMGGAEIAKMYNDMVPDNYPQMVYDGDSQFHMEG